MMRALARWVEDVRFLPPRTLTRRALMAAAYALALTLTMTGTLLYASVPPVPFYFIPDARAPFLFLGALLAAGVACGGASARRTFLLWSTVGALILFHMETATVHWFTSFPGSVTGTRLDPFTTGASLAALAALVLLHAEVEAYRFARETHRRGVPREEALDGAEGLLRAAQRRVARIGLAAAGLGGVVIVTEWVFKDEPLGSAPVALAAAGLLLAAALVYALRAWGSVAERAKAKP